MPELAFQFFLERVRTIRNRDNQIIDTVSEDIFDIFLYGPFKILLFMRFIKPLHPVIIAVCALMAASDICVNTKALKGSQILYGYH